MEKNLIIMLIKEALESRVKIEEKPDFKAIEETMIPEDNMIIIEEIKIKDQISNTEVFNLGEKKIF